MDATTEKAVVEREIQIAASPETVWQLLTDPAEVVRWMGQTAEFDLRPGGAYRMEVIPEHAAGGTFVEIDPPRKLVYTWGWESGPVPVGSTTVEYELLPRDGGTMLRFRHFDLPNTEAAESHAHGWDHYFERLALLAAGEDPGRGPWLDDPMS